MEHIFSIASALQDSAFSKDELDKIAGEATSLTGLLGDLSIEKQNLDDVVIQHMRLDCFKLLVMLGGMYSVDEQMATRCLNECASVYDLICTVCKELFGNPERTSKFLNQLKEMKYGKIERSELALKDRSLPVCSKCKEQLPVNFAATFDIFTEKKDESPTWSYVKSFLPEFLYSKKDPVDKFVIHNSVIKIALLRMLDGELCENCKE